MAYTFHRARRAALDTLVAFMVTLLAAASVNAQSPGHDRALEALLDGLEARHIGPVGNRVSAVTGIPGDPTTYLIGAASGGIWKTTDGGHGWDPVFDDHDVQSIGALAVAPSDHDVIWAGTGEPWIRSNVSHGNGVYRSDDRGDTWRLVGLPESGRVGRILVHPDDPDVAYVAALGHLYGPQEERGVFRTTDGGETWERVLHPDPMTGAFDLWMVPGDPETIFASTWTMHVRTWGRWSGGPNDGIWRTTDGGDTWEMLEGGGLPSGTLGKIALGGTPADPDRIYAMIETNVNSANGPLDPGGADPDEHQGVLWRSDDRGATWTMVQAEHRIQQRPHYYTRLHVAPDDPDQVHFMATSYSVTDDGGPSLRGGGGNGGDFHDMWIDPTMPDRMILGHDQGLSISMTRGRDWYRPLLPIAQMYHVQVDDEIPYNVYGNRQDGPSTMGPSRVLYGGSIPVGEWRSVGGCESGWAVPDTVNDVVWSGCYEGILDVHDLETRTSRTVTVWPDNPEAWPAGPLRYRFQWTFPITVSQFEPSLVYVGSQHVHRTTNFGQSWEVISPDLSTGQDSLLRKTGGLTPDDAGPTYAAVVFAIAESPMNPAELWAGTNDGKLWRTRNGGGEWTDLTDRLPDLPVYSTISSIEVSRHQPGKVYVAVDGHQINVFDPILYRTDDGGETWTRIDGDIPRGPLSFTHVLQEDPEREGLLYAGTGNGLYVSQTDGEYWVRYEGIPPAPVHWVEVQDRFDDLVIATYGRGFWIVDDINPLQDPPEIARFIPYEGEAIPADAAAYSIRGDDPHLFAPRDAYRWVSQASPFSQPGVPAAGDSGPDDAIISYWLPEGDHDVSMEILDANGTSIADVRASGEPGFQRTTWNLRHRSSDYPTMRTAPLEHAHDELSDAGTRRPGDGGSVSPAAIPGTYTVRLTVDGEAYEASLTVLADPTSTGSMEGMRAQLEMALELRDMTNRVVTLIDSLEVERARLLELEETSGLTAAQQARYDALTELEMQLTDLRLTGGQDSLWWGRQLFAKITSLGGYISGSDHGPTDQAREVQELYVDLLEAAEAAWARLRGRVIAQPDGSGA